MKLVVPLLFACVLAMPGFSRAEGSTAREALAALDALRLQPSAAYKVAPKDRIELRRADAVLSLDNGIIAFFSSLDGRVTGAVFSGQGHILATPRHLVEKQQMALFLGTPILDENLSSVYMRFSDSTATELHGQLQKAHVSPQDESAFENNWDPVLARLNPTQSLRLYSERLTLHPRPYFYAMIDGTATGPFEFLFDQSREEPVLFGQERKSGTSSYYDVWASYRIPGVEAPIPAFHAESYSIDATIHRDDSMDASTSIRIRTEISGERLLTLQLAPDLNVASVSLVGGAPLPHFHNEIASPQARKPGGSNYLIVILPQAPSKGDIFDLKFQYHGTVIRDAGNGVLFVGDRNSWYPHLGGSGDFADYDLVLRWPRQLRLAATGLKIDEHEEGQYKVGHWRSEEPASVAGFNLGDYAYASFPSSGYSVDVYANQMLEQALLNRLRPPDLSLEPHVPVFPGIPTRNQALAMPLPPPSPAEALQQLGKEIDSSIRFYERYCGPFPYRQLNVSQIPGTFGQGWPGLLYISTYSFLPAQIQAQAGLSRSGEEHFTDLVPFHEVAHQWWGNVVGWSSYRDQWIDEAIANYLALLFVDSQKKPELKLRVWLNRYRANLTEKAAGGNMPIVDYGSLTLGSRLTSSKTPEGFEQLIYGKGSWVIHMLREMLRQPGAKDPDERFIGLLHTLLAKYKYRALSTEDFQREVEAIMTPSMDLEDNHSMDWFFDEWVRGTGIPHYRVEYSTRRTKRGVLVRGTIYQTGVPDWFVAPVPLYSGRGAYLGRVIAGGHETPFRFVSLKEPGKIQIDPHMTLLCVTQH
jgi:Peptidase family M1 domain